MIMIGINNIYMIVVVPIGLQQSGASLGFYLAKYKIPPKNRVSAFACVSLFPREETPISVSVTLDVRHLRRLEMS